MDAAKWDAMFDAAWKANRGNLVRYATRVVGPDYSEDIVQEAFVEVHCARRADFLAPPMLFGRVTWRCKDLIKRRAREGGMPVGPKNGAPIDGGDPKAQEEWLVRWLVERLPESEQDTILMRYWGGLDHEEIAEGQGA